MYYILYTVYYIIYTRLHLDHAADLLVPADHGVQPARLRICHQVAAVLQQRLVI